VRGPFWRLSPRRKEYWGMVALFTIALFFGTVSVAMLLRSLGEPFVTAWWLTLGSVVCLCFFGTASGLVDLPTYSEVAARQGC